MRHYEEAEAKKGELRIVSELDQLCAEARDVARGSPDWLEQVIGQIEAPVSEDAAEGFDAAMMFARIGWREAILRILRELDHDDDSIPGLN